MKRITLVIVIEADDQCEPEQVRRAAEAALEVGTDGEECEEIAGGAVRLVQVTLL